MKIGCFSFHSPMHKGLKIVLAYSLNMSGWQNVKDSAQKSLETVFLFSHVKYWVWQNVVFIMDILLKYFSHLSSKYKHQNGPWPFGCLVQWRQSLPTNFRHQDELFSVSHRKDAQIDLHRNNSIFLTAARGRYLNPI